MAEKVFLVHGWSVNETTTYQALHRKLADNGYDLQQIYLGRYVSLDNEVEIRDIAKAMHNELLSILGDNWNEPFHIITHSTGALIVRYWITKFYQDAFAEQSPMRNCIFLAGPQFGSRLAHHGRSMLAHAVKLGDTGKKILNALELGSSFSWNLAEEWLDESSWRENGARYYCLTGHKVDMGKFFQRKIFPAHFEKGSDMVIRIPAANLNFRRFNLDATTSTIEMVGSVDGIAFGALKDFTHGGDEEGIMNSIKSDTEPEEHLALKLILECLDVDTDEAYEQMKERLDEVTAETMKEDDPYQRKPYAQLDFRFHDEDMEPITDYVFKLGYFKNGKEHPSETVVHTHKNMVNGEHFTVFIDYSRLNPEREYFLEFDSRTDTPLVNFTPDPYRVNPDSKIVSEIIVSNQTTQIDVKLTRDPERNLFIFHPGDDPDLHVKWNRHGDIRKKGMDWE